MYVSAVVLAISAARWGLRSETVMTARRESLTDLTVICAGQRAPDRRQVVVRPARRRVVGIVRQAELLGGALSDAGRLDDAILRLVELLVAQNVPGPELDDVLGAGQDLWRLRIDDQLAARLVDLRLPVGVDEGDDRRDNDRQDHERPPLADRAPVGAEIELGFARIGKVGVASTLLCDGIHGRPLYHRGPFAAPAERLEWPA